MKLPQYENKPFKSPVVSIGNRTTQQSFEGSVARTYAPKPSHLGNSQKTIKKRPIEALTTPSTSTTTSVVKNYYFTTYRKRTTKKNKTWDGDGLCTELENGGFRFYKENGQFMGSGKTSTADDIYEKVFSCAGFEIQLDSQICEEPEMTRIAALLGKSTNTSAVPSRHTSMSPSPPKIVDLRVQKPNIETIPVKRFQQSSQRILSASKTGTASFTPLFDSAKIENALVMNNFEEAEVEVVVDPILSRHLRPHQRVGVKFMYDCVMGLSRPTDYEDDGNTIKRLEKTDGLNGCLLADEMGLGKTLMTITLIWTLLKQTPLPSKTTTAMSGLVHQGVCSKVLVICPVTLIGNWKREFQKWLNLNRIGVLTLSTKSTPEKDKLEVRNFLKVQRSYQVLIIGYEKLLSVSDTLIECRSSIGMLVCDEGHRLKNGQSKTLNVLKALEVPRKVLLTGTPIQNDLSEFYTILSFLNDGILSSYPKFKRDFINPIAASRDVNNKFNEVVQEKGAAKSQELIELTKKLTLRRTSDTIARFLPPKTDVILFCRPTSSQLRAFEKVLRNTSINMSNMTYSSSLALITLFKKICNSPSLVHQDTFYLENAKSNVAMTDASKPDSGKLRVLMNILKSIQTFYSEEKVVIVSNYTRTLDVIQNLLNAQNFSNIRLDGSTPSKERDRIVNTFNSAPSIFTFLLSAKSGGVGLNLIGASRLVLFDNDWNPAIDHQAMSRIHRDGQEKACFIYRLFSTGCLDEKIFQRQLMKNSLSSKFMGGPGKATNMESNDDLFAVEELKDLFTVLTDTPSNTHDLICACAGYGEEQDEDNTEDRPPAKKSRLANAGSSQLEGWTNAMQLQTLIQSSQEESIAEKARLVRECLAGYKHINPQNQLNPEPKLAIDWEGDITFAFLKEYTT
ncbi:LAFA_0D04148g1_1 [Lachancea sp. 'fantastica']|nr:LAFA_0D04148g1_1 [Lachancea sp. 'fantastica']